jgi:hypothetical protein
LKQSGGCPVALVPGDAILRAGKKASSGLWISVDKMLAPFRETVKI